MDNNFNQWEKIELKNVVNSFIGSYTERDKSVDFSDWLSERLRQEMPDMTAEASKKLGEEIIAGVAGYDRALGDLNKVVESGQSKEGWLADRMVEIAADMPIDEAGDGLRQIENDLNISNARLMQDTQEISTEIIEAEIVEWNEYSLKDKALNVGKQAVMAGLGAAANVIKNNLESGDSADIGEILGEALQEGIGEAAGEVKAVVAGAIKTAVENNLTDILPDDTPTEFICDIAGVAVDGAGALADAAMGKITIIEALEKIGRAGVAAFSRMAANALKFKLSLIPVAGPAIVKLAGGLFEHMSSPKFTENVYAVVRDAASATWEGIKAQVRGILNMNVLKNDVKNTLLN